LVVAVNKYDSWEGLLPNFDLRQISPYAQTTDGQVGIDLSALTHVSQMVQALVRETAPEIIAACESFCDDIMYIPISPQGCSPVKGESFGLGVRPGDLSPVWAEVPLLYSICKAKCALLPALRVNGQSDGALGSMGSRVAPDICQGTG
jgi:hypothetical protein